jgi:hypothetical protein
MQATGRFRAHAAAACGNQCDLLFSLSYPFCCQAMPALLEIALNLTCLDTWD